VCVLRPASRGTVTLASADARVAPVIDPRFLSDPRDLDALANGARIARRILDAPALAQANSAHAPASGQLRRACRQNCMPVRCGTIADVRRTARIRARTQRADVVNGR